jgi:sec-independent protein translocase protein TatC
MASDQGGETRTMGRLKRRARRPKPDEMTLIEHLAELRKRIIICIAAVALLAVVAFIIYGPILSFLEQPYCQTFPHHCKLYVTSPLDGLSLRVKISAYGGLVMASPIWLWNLWRFITPGLKPNEKRYAVPFVVSSIVLFLLGAAVAYLIFPHALGWLHSIGGPSLKMIYSPISYLNLIILMMVMFGITFEFPVLLVSLELANVLKPKQLSQWRRWAIVGVTLFAAIFVPSGDPFSMAAMAIPMYIFYEASILVGWLVDRARRRHVPATEPAASAA